MFSQVGSRLTSEHAQQRTERNDHSNSAHGHHCHFAATDTGDCGGWQLRILSLRQFRSDHRRACRLAAEGPPRALATPRPERTREPAMENACRWHGDLQPRATREETPHPPAGRPRPELWHAAILSAECQGHPATRGHRALPSRRPGPAGPGPSAARLPARTSRRPRPPAWRAAGWRRFLPARPVPLGRPHPG